MKNKFVVLAFAGSLFLSTGCDKGFEDVNKNPVLSTTIDPVYLFSNAQFSSAVVTYNYQSEIVQQIITPYTGVLEGGNHNIVYDPNANTLYNAMYTGPVKYLTDIINQTKTDEKRSNL